VEWHLSLQFALDPPGPAECSPINSVLAQMAACSIVLSGVGGRLPAGTFSAGGAGLALGTVWPKAEADEPVLPPLWVHGLPAGRDFTVGRSRGSGGLAVEEAAAGTFAFGRMVKGLLKEKGG
jgi:hypothetical protein